MASLLDLRTVKGFKGASETPFTDNLLGVNTGKTLTGQEFSDNPFIKPVQQFNKALGTGLLETGEKAFNVGMGLVNLPFAFAGDTAEGVYEMLPEDWQAKTSQLMYKSGGSMDPDEFGDQFYGHLVEGVFAFPTLSEFQPWFTANKGKKPPKEIVEAIVEKIGTQPNKLSQQLYLSYNKNINNPKQFVSNKVDVPENYLKEIADFYEGAKHQPNHPKIQSSYNALIEETLAQYQHMIDGGIVPAVYNASKGKPEPYVSSGHMMADVANNKQLKFLKTNLDDLPPNHPLAQPSGITLNGQELLMNDVFRIVHDFYGHTPNGFQFGPKGEYNAFRSHANMYSDEALSALANETLFQNAWVNYNKTQRRKDGTVPKPNDPDFVPQNERPFADQKVILIDESLLNKDPNLNTVNAFIELTDTQKAKAKNMKSFANPKEKMFGDENTPTPQLKADLINNDMPALIYEYDWYTKSPKNELDFGKLFFEAGNIQNTKLKDSLFFLYKKNKKTDKKDPNVAENFINFKVDLENQIKKNIIEREKIVNQAESFQDAVQIKNNLDTKDIKAVNKYSGLNIPENTITISPEGKIIDAKFVAGKKSKDGQKILSSGELSKLVDVGLKPDEFKRLTYILSDGIKSWHRIFQNADTANALGVVYRQKGVKHPVLNNKIKLLNEKIWKDQIAGKDVTSLQNEVKKLNRINEDKLNVVMRQDMENMLPYSPKEMDVLSHEFGHLLHERLTVDTIPDFLKNSNFDLELATKELIAVSKEQRPKLWNDRQILKNMGEDEFVKKLPNPENAIKEQLADIQNYRNLDHELLADFIKGYLKNPSQTKELAPNMSKILRELVNKSWFSNILQLSKNDVMPKDGLLKKQEINSGLLNTAMV